MENSMDPVHFEWLHANQSNWQNEKNGLEPYMFPARHQRVRFPNFEHDGDTFGIYKQRLLVGENPDTSPDWNIGHPVLFPNILALSGQGAGHSFQVRVPIDDFNTYHVNISVREVKEGEEPTMTVRELPCLDEKGLPTNVPVVPQDMMAWITQGWYGTPKGITPRHLEHLGISDRGITQYREALFEAMDNMEKGGDPPGLVFTIERNDTLSAAMHGEGEGGGSLRAFNLEGGRRGPAPAGTVTQ
jgi:5,5'-dehydrodivanillate O-demethylase